VIGSPEMVATAYTSIRMMRFTFFRSLADRRVTSSTLYAIVEAWWWFQAGREECIYIGGGCGLRLGNKIFRLSFLSTPV
jgi:hypothetical protein